MTQNICNKCEKQFSTTSSYTRHLNRKTPCDSKNKSREVVENVELNLSPIQVNVEASEALPQTNIDTSTKTGLRFIDLFCGIGGFHQALIQLNATCVFASDIDAKCREIYEQNYGLKPDGDITKIDVKTIPDFDILCGGFPCQSFSNSGKKKGLSDDRGQLFEYILNIVREKRPKFMFLENVKHIKKIDNGNVLKHIIKRINETGYVVNDEQIYELSPHQFGVPQQRERVVFVCIRNDIYDASKIINMNVPNTPINVDAILEKVPNKIIKYKISTEIENVLTAWDQMIQHVEVGETLSPTIMCHEFNTLYTDTEFSQLASWKQDYITKNKPLYNKYKEKWDEWYDSNGGLLKKREIYGKLEWQTGKKQPDDSIFNHFIQLRQSGIRVKKNKYFPTLVAIVQTPIYAKERRYITPRECARLQSFPDSFQMHTTDQVAYKQFGNAVNVVVVHFAISNTLKAYGYI